MPAENKRPQFLGLLKARSGHAVKILAAQRGGTRDPRVWAQTIEKRRWVACKPNLKPSVFFANARGP